MGRFVSELEERNRMAKMKQVLIDFFEFFSFDWGAPRSGFSRSVDRYRGRVHRRPHGTEQYKTVDCRFFSLPSLTLPQLLFLLVWKKFNAIQINSLIKMFRNSALYGKLKLSILSRDELTRGWQGTHFTSHTPTTWGVRWGENCWN